MKRLGLLTRIYLGLVAFCLCGSAFAALTGKESGFIAPIASAVTLIVGLAAVIKPALSSPKDWVALAIVLVTGAVIEIIGLLTGLPFGKYEYTDAWFPTIMIAGHHFPLLVPFAWLLVTSASYLVAHQIQEDFTPRGRTVNEVVPIFVGAFLATLIDIPMEWPLAGELGYWNWIEPGPLPGGAPILNPIGWFLTALVACVILSRSTLGMGAGSRSASRETGYDAIAVLVGHLTLLLGIGLIGLFRQ